jgi:hypothetical protein
MGDILLSGPPLRPFVTAIEVDGLSLTSADPPRDLRLRGKKVFDEETSASEVHMPSMEQPRKYMRYFVMARRRVDRQDICDIVFRLDWILGLHRRNENKMDGVKKLQTLKNI